MEKTEEAPGEWSLSALCIATVLPALFLGAISWWVASHDELLFRWDCISEIKSRLISPPSFKLVSFRRDDNEYGEPEKRAHIRYYATNALGVPLAGRAFCTEIGDGVGVHFPD